MAIAIEFPLAEKTGPAEYIKGNKDVVANLQVLN
jgi:hypothetical protein